jgi:hypothetical protein
MKEKTISNLENQIALVPGFSLLLRGPGSGITFDILIFVVIVFFIFTAVVIIVIFQNGRPSTTAGHSL